MNKTIIISEEQSKELDSLFNDTLLDDVNGFFSIETLKTAQWKNGEEIIKYCEGCNLYKIGEGLDRVVFQIDDDKVIKIEKSNPGNSQNSGEVHAFRSCDENMRQFIPHIYEWDTNHVEPLWIIAEQVLPAKYADFQKLLGFEFGSYNDVKEKEEMRKDLETYSKYPGKTVNKYSFNLMEFLEAYGEDDLDLYYDIIKQNKWVKELYKLLRKEIVAYWELENINNWGLVKRNGKPKLIILDIGI